MQPTPGITLNSPSSKLGGQLSRRVASGAISQKQANRTADQRQTLAKAYGQNWRQRVFGNQAGKLGSLRKSASEGDIGSKNELGVLREKRQNLLSAARGGLSQGKPVAPKMGLRIPSVGGRNYLRANGRGTKASEYGPRAKEYPSALHAAIREAREDVRNG